jgi:peptidoglycan-associated lipoprotein
MLIEETPRPRALDACVLICGAAVKSRRGKFSRSPQYDFRRTYENTLGSRSIPPRAISFVRCITRSRGARFLLLERASDQPSKQESSKMRLIRGSLFIVAVGPLLTGCLATKGALQRAKEEQAAALAQTNAALESERQTRAASDSALSQQLGIVRGDVQQLRSELQTLKTEFGAKISMLEDGLHFMMPVNFAFNDASVRETDRGALTRFANVVTKYYPGSKITIEGFADPAGSPRYNLDLSARRASAVRDYLRSSGLTSNELNAIGYGETRLVAPGASHEQPGAELNRRVVFVVETAAQRSVALATPEMP